MGAPFRICHLDTGYKSRIRLHIDQIAGWVFPSYRAACGIGIEDRIDPHDIDKAKVELTMMDGVVRHRDGI